MERSVNSKDVLREREVLLAYALLMVVVGGVKGQVAIKEQKAELFTARPTVEADDANTLVARRVLKAAQITV